MAQPAGVKRTAGEWLRDQSEPRDRRAAARAATALLVLAAVVTGTSVLAGPPVTDPVAGTLAAVDPVVLLLIAGGVHRWAGRGPRLLWVLPPVLGAALLTVLDVLTADASAAAQSFLCFPVLYAASQLRPLLAVVVLQVALIGDAIVNLSVLPRAQAVDSFAFVGSTLVAITVLLVRSALHQDRLTAELRRQAAIDPLTGLVTRRVLDDAAHTALASAGHNEGTSLVLLDIDNFKTINDTLGHPVGDAALVHVSAVVAGLCRPHDVLSRLGGDEIALLVPGCSAQAGDERAEMVAMAVRETPLSTPDGPVLLTVSVGVAHAPTHAGDLRELYTAADTALYDAKRAGRNRVGRVRVPPGGRPRDPAHPSHP